MINYAMASCTIIPLKIRRDHGRQRDAVLLGFAGGDHFVDHEIDLAPSLSAMLASLVCDTGIRV